MIILVAILWLALFLLFIKFVIMLANIPESKIQTPLTLKTVHVHIHNKAKITMNLKPQDLRLGILIHDTVRNTNTTLQLKHFRELSISEEQFFNRYKPVAITEEIVIEVIRLSYGDPILSFIRPFALRTKYVHQIQTLYYGASQTELNISKFLLCN